MIIYYISDYVFFLEMAKTYSAEEAASLVMNDDGRQMNSAHFLDEDSSFDCDSSFDAELTSQSETESDEDEFAFCGYQVLLNQAHQLP